MILPSKKIPGWKLKLTKENSKQKNRGQKHVRIFDGSEENKKKSNLDE